MNMGSWVSSQLSTFNSQTYEKSYILLVDVDGRTCAVANLTYAYGRGVCRVEAYGRGYARHLLGIYYDKCRPRVRD